MFSKPRTRTCASWIDRQMIRQTDNRDVLTNTHVPDPCASQIDRQSARQIYRQIASQKNRQITLLPVKTMGMFSQPLTRSLCQLDRYIVRQSARQLNSQITTNQDNGYVLIDTHQIPVPVRQIDSQLEKYIDRQSARKIDRLPCYQSRQWVYSHRHVPDLCASWIDR